MVLLCNDLPHVPPFDEGTWRRLKVLEFRSKFVDNPRADNEFPRDRYLSEKLIIWRETFMGLLLQYYRKYRETGLKIPTSVVQFTKEYQKGMDQYHEFIDTRLEFTKQKEDKIDLNEIYVVFQEWYENNVQSHRIPSKQELKKYLEKKFGKGFISVALICGFRWKEIQEEPN
jgi:phage/plasmid-associated DNA primase